MPAIQANLSEVQQVIMLACARAKRDPATVSIIAVTKSQGPEVLPALIAAGCSDFGENRVDHLQVMHAAAPAPVRFHAIGRIQSRQLRELVACCVSVHSLCEVHHLRKLDELCQAAGKRMSVFLQVNTSKEASKAGLTPEATPEFLDLARRHHALDVIGLMTMAPEMPDGAMDDGRIRSCFRDLASLGKVLGLPRLSMGMSQDFTIAIEEGATDVRIGTRLFV
jgi:pyridoxal phosphate enzyme (YggS family)